MTRDEALIRRFCAMNGYDPDAIDAEGRSNLENHFDTMEAAFAALDTFNLGVTETWKALGESAQDPNQMSFSFRGDNVIDLKTHAA